MDGSQIPTVMAMTITADSLLSMPKCGYDGGYDVFVKGPSVVVLVGLCSFASYIA